MMVFIVERERRGQREWLHLDRKVLPSGSNMILRSWEPNIARATPVDLVDARWYAGVTRSASLRRIV